MITSYLETYARHADEVLAQGELDELEREEFFRLKKVQAKKKKDMAATEADAKAKLAKVGVAGSGGGGGGGGGMFGGGGDSGNLLEPERDDDLLF